MGAIGPWQIIIILIIALLLFGGGGRLSSIMGDFAKGIRSFRKGLEDDDEKAIEAPRDSDREIETPRQRETSRAD